VTIGSQQGLIVAMDERGRLSVVFLGTWPEGSAIAGDRPRWRCFSSSFVPTALHALFASNRWLSTAAQ
jgi:hypothetical protein